EKIFRKEGLKIFTGSSVEKVDTKGKGVKVTLKTPKGEETISADVVLSAVGVVGNVENIGLEKAGVEHERGTIKVDRDTYRTTAANIYAIGDVAGGPWLAHKASHEAVICVEKLAGKDPLPLNYNNIPGCTYCEPQVA